MTAQEMMDFCRANLPAMMLLTQAANDYADARCLLLCGRPGGGLVTAAQSIEKFFKARLLFEDASLDVKKIGHRLSSLLQKAIASDPRLIKFESEVRSLEKHYNTRYPDNPNQSGVRSTEELFLVDQLAVFLSFEMPIPRNVMIRSGIFGLIGEPQTPNTNPSRIWMLESNAPLLFRMKDFMSLFAEGMKEMYGLDVDRSLWN